MYKEIEFNKKENVWEDDGEQVYVKFKNGILYYFDEEYGEWYTLGCEDAAEDIDKDKEITKKIYLDMKKYYEKE